MKIHRNAKRIGLAVIGVIAALGIGLAMSGYWPVAFVGYHPITYRAFAESVVLTGRVYESNVRLAGGDPTTAATRQARAAVQKAAMEALIERTLIDAELGQRMGGSDLDRLVREKIADAHIDDKTLKGAELLYGTGSAESFQELIVVPKAKADILEGNLFLEGATLAQWIANCKAQTRIAVFVPGLHWDGTEVKTD